MRLKLISCEVFYREMAATSARSPNHIEVEALPARLGSHPCKLMRKRLQDAIDHADRSRFQAVLLGFGICSSALAGLKAGSIPLVIPRECDCISRLLSNSCSGTKFVRRTAAVHLGSASNLTRVSLPRSPGNIPHSRRARFNCGLGHLAAHYGHEIADYFSYQFRDRPQGYNPLLSLHLKTRDDLAQNSQFWNRQNLHPSRSNSNGEDFLFQRLVDGYWSFEEFLVVPPGWHVAKHFEQGIIAVEDTP